MTPAPSTPPPTLRRVRSKSAPVAQPDHRDISELTGAVRDLAQALKPLEALAEHVPTLVEIAQAWNAGKNGGRAVWRVGEITGAIAKWIGAVGVAIAVLSLAAHAKWAMILKGFEP